MIAEAWYPIHYFRLSFGKLDSLESNILEIQRILEIPIDANKDVVRETILKNIENQSIRRCLSIFTLNVPYRFLSPWIPKATNAQVEKYSREFFNNCPYAIAGKSILVDDIWAEYLLEFIDLSPKTQSNCTGYPVQISQAITESSLISSAPFLGPLHSISWACSLYLYQCSIDSRRI